MLYCVRETADDRVLTNCTQEKWKIVADGLSYKILNEAPALHSHYKGITVDSYSNEYGVYFRISCMTKEMYEKFIAKTKS